MPPKPEELFLKGLNMSGSLAHRSYVFAAGLLFSQRLRSVVRGNGCGTVWDSNQNISAIIHIFSQDSTTRVPVVKSHD